MTLLRALPLLLALTLPGLASAQEVEADVGGGEAPAVYASPGLEPGTPDPNLTEPDQVPLYMEQDHLVGRVSIPDDKLAVLVQPEGRTWRAFRIQGLFWTATAAILLTVGALAAFFLYRGRIRIESGRSGRWVPRFGSVERFAHWLTALSFIVLALTGLVVTFGRWLLIPLIGHGNFTALAEASKSLHNWSGLPFLIGIVLMAVFWLRDNLPEKADLEWLRQGGGMFKKGNHGSYHPETARFNAGQKLIFWSVIGGGLILTVTGYFLMAPFIVTGVNGMQIAHAVHAIMAVVLIAIIIAHIYLGTLGMEGAFDAMGRGEVDENWAREHHRGWYEAQVRSGRASDPAAGARSGGKPTVPAE